MEAIVLANIVREYRLLEITNQDGKFYYRVCVEETDDTPGGTGKKQIDLGICKAGMMSNGMLYFFSWPSMI